MAQQLRPRNTQKQLFRKDDAWAVHEIGALRVWIAVERNCAERTAVDTATTPGSKARCALGHVVGSVTT